MTTTTIILVNKIDTGRLEEIKSEMAVLGSPTVRAFEACGYLVAIEGSHRLAAAAEIGLPVHIERIDTDEYGDYSVAGTVDFATLDYDSNNWFDETVVSVGDFIAWFTKSPFPAGQPTVDVEVG
jgi:hypothetical protein